MNTNSGQQPNAITTDSESGSITVMTLYIEDSLYAIPIENVVSLSKETNHIQELPIKTPGLVGVSHYQNTVVPVIDIAERIGVKSGNDGKKELIETLSAREQDHVAWLDALEKSIKNGEKFQKERDPLRCEFGRWFDEFQSRNEALDEIMSQFEAPHNQIHALADELLTLCEKGETDAALKQLSYHRITTMRRLQSLFSHAREQLTEMMRPILLYVTRDGKVPAYALLIDEVHDAMTYKLKDCYSPAQVGIQSLSINDKYIKAILSDKKQENSILLNVDQILEAEQIAAVKEVAA